MLSKWRWQLRQFGRRLWVRASLFSLVAVGTALASIYLAPLVPDELSDIVGSDAVDSILTILASSMLTVTTFSLTVMVTAYGAATTNATPRATKLLIADPTTQNALGTFLGSFLFSLVGIIALSTGLYGERGRVILFGATVVVIVFIIVTFLRWIDYLSKLGRVGETIDRVERTATDALRERMRNPNLGGRPLPGDMHSLAARGRPVRAEKIGYVQHIDVPALSERARGGVEVYVNVLPGQFVGPSDTLAWLVGASDEAAAARARQSFTVSDDRSFDQDPRFGLIVLTEIASRALSPAVNDPGTAIDVIGRAVRVLALWVGGQEDLRHKAGDEAQGGAQKGAREGRQGSAQGDSGSETRDEVQTDARYRNVYVPSLSLDDLFDDVFTPIARDGASNIGVQVRLMKALCTLAGLEAPEVRRTAERHARLALKRAEMSLELPEDLDRLHAVAAWVPQAENGADSGETGRS